MASRKRIPDSTQAEVLVQSRRRCCICFGLNRDEEVKKGQIAHLDGKSDNNNIENLAFLCFDHHDEFDTSTSQSKGLNVREALKYREELHYHYGNWSARLERDALLNFLAFASADLDSMAKAAINAAGTSTCFGRQLAIDVLTQDEFDSCDGDLYIPYLNTLDYFASWGWLTFEHEERKVPEDIDRVFITIKRKAVCREVANAIQKISLDESPA